MANIIGICRLCLKRGELCDSHALPNSVFKYIFRKSQGKAIVLTGDSNTAIQNSSDSWSQSLLCYACEGKLNKNFDQYGISVFRGNQGQTKIQDEGIAFRNIDKVRLKGFFLSLLWRISISQHANYSNINLPYALEEELREALMEERKFRGSLSTVAIYRLRDSTKIDDFSQEGLREFVMSPFGREYTNGPISVCFLFFGYFIEIFISKIPAKYLSRPGVIAGDTPILLAPYLEFLEVPEILLILTNAVKKHQDGNSVVS